MLLRNSTISAKCLPQRLVYGSSWIDIWHYYNCPQLVFDSSPGTSVTTSIHEPHIMSLHLHLVLGLKSSWAISLAKLSEWLLTLFSPYAAACLSLQLSGWVASFLSVNNTKKRFSKERELNIKPSTVFFWIWDTTQVLRSQEARSSGYT